MQVIIEFAILHWFKTNKLCNLCFNVVLYIQDAWRLYLGCLTITTSDILSIFQLFWDGLAYWARCSLHTYLVSHSNFWYLLMKTLIWCVSRLLVWFDQITYLAHWYTGELNSNSIDTPLLFQFYPWSNHIQLSNWIMDRVSSQGGENHIFSNNAK